MEVTGVAFIRENVNPKQYHIREELQRLVPELERSRGGGPHVFFNSPVWSVQETGEWWRTAVNYQIIKPILTLIAAATLDVVSSLEAD